MNVLLNMQNVEGVANTNMNHLTNHRWPLYHWTVIPFNVLFMLIQDLGLLECFEMITIIGCNAQKKRLLMYYLWYNPDMGRRCCKEQYLGGTVPPKLRRRVGSSMRRDVPSQPTRGSWGASLAAQHDLGWRPGPKRIFEGQRTLLFAPIYWCFEFVSVVAWHIWGHGGGLGQLPPVPKYNRLF